LPGIVGDAFKHSSGSDCIRPEADIAGRSLEIGHGHYWRKAASTPSRGLLAPKGTPTPVVDLLAKEIKRVLNEPGMFEKFDVLGFTIVGSTPAEFAELIKRETVRWPKVIKELGITAG
jgi:hypothetical protein